MGTNGRVLIWTGLSPRCMSAGNPWVFVLVTVAEQSQVSAEATLRNYSMWKVKINVYFSFDLQSFMGYVCSRIVNSYAY